MYRVNKNGDSIPTPFETVIKERLGVSSPFYTKPVLPVNEYSNHHQRHISVNKFLKK